MNNAGGASKCSRWMERLKYPSLFIPDFDFNFLSHLSVTVPIHAKQGGVMFTVLWGSRDAASCLEDMQSGVITS